MNWLNGRLLFALAFVFFSEVTSVQACNERLGLEAELQLNSWESFSEYSLLAYRDDEKFESDASLQLTIDPSSYVGELHLMFRFYFADQERIGIPYNIYALQILDQENQELYYREFASDCLGWSFGSAQALTHLVKLYVNPEAIRIRVWGNLR